MSDRSIYRWALIAILTLAVLLGSLRLNRYTLTYGDEARFLILAQSLRFKHNYALVGAHGPVAERQYPPGLPLIVALTMWLTDTGQPLNTSILPAKIAVLILYLVALLLLYDLLRQYRPPWIALATLLVIAVHPLITPLATEPMSDIPFFICQYPLALADGASVKLDCWR
ncbi:MAG: hypothetical protein GY759_13620 [Chloroflexi bacterium]|nr:hypothetical protein [Chloroflexota bacterium]